MPSLGSALDANAYRKVTLNDLRSNETLIGVKLEKSKLIVVQVIRIDKPITSLDVEYTITSITAQPTYKKKFKDIVNGSNELAYYIAR